MFSITIITLIHSSYKAMLCVVAFEGGELVKGDNINHLTLPLRIGKCVSRLPALVVYCTVGRVLTNAASVFFVLDPVLIVPLRVMADVFQRLLQVVSFW